MEAGHSKFPEGPTERFVTQPETVATSDATHPKGDRVLTTVFSSKPRR